MAVILNSAMLDSDTLFSSLRFTQKHSLSILTLTQTNSIWIKLIHSHSTWLGQQFWICQFALSHLSFPSQTHSHLPRLVLNICTKNFHSFILTQLENGSHLEICHHGFSHFAQKELHSFILTQHDVGSHLEFCHFGIRHFHLGFRHLVFFSQIHSKTLSLHSDSDSN